jgi:hypothetical protein
VTAFSPAVAAACPKCYGASGPQVLSMYYLSTLILTLLPFAVLGTIGAIGWHFKHRAERARGLCDGDTRDLRREVNSPAQ